MAPGIPPTLAVTGHVDHVYNRSFVLFARLYQTLCEHAKTGETLKNFSRHPKNVLVRLRFVFATRDATRVCRKRWEKDPEG